MEVWKEIKEFNKYEVSTDGNVRNKITLKIISQKSLDKDGYPTVKLYDNNDIRKKVYVHRLVAETFIPNPENLKSVGRRDGDKLKNPVSNLFWKRWFYVL